MFLLTLYRDIIYRPLLNLLIFFYNNIPGHDIGIAIIVMTVLIRLLLAPSFQKSLKSQRALNELQPKLNEIRKKYKDDKEGEAKAMMQLYKDQNINPLSSCLPIIIQLPILIALYQAFRTALGHNNITGLYSYIHQPNTINPYFLHIVNLSRAALSNSHWYVPAVVLAVIAGFTQFVQSKMMMPKTTTGDATTQVLSMQTTYILPVFSIVIAMKLPAGLPLYWIITTLFAVAQQYYIMRGRPKPQQA